MADEYRTELVTKFLCVECGRVLRVMNKATVDRVSVEVAGINLHIYPCESCYGKAREPLLALKAAIRAAEEA